jgi:hypothetical protein
VRKGEVNKMAKTKEKEGFCNYTETYCPNAEDIKPRQSDSETLDCILCTLGIICAKLDGIEEKLPPIYPKPRG